MLAYELNKKQFAALEGLAYWIANKYYITERFGYDDPEIKVCHDTILSLFDELDALKVPFWVQNSVIAIGENWRKYKSNYFDFLLKEKNIYKGW